MQVRVFATAALLAMVIATVARSADIKSGLQVGDSVPTYTATKCGGGTSDGIKVDASLCFT